MNQNPTETRMRELLWRPTLNSAEQLELRALLEAHPDLAAQQTEELALNRLIERLPDAPVPTNFTARVMQDIAREESAAERARSPSASWWQRLVPRLAFAAVLVAAGLFAWQRNLSYQQQREAADMVAVSDTKDLLSVEVLQDFDSIAKMGSSVPPDTELLSLLQ